MRVKPKIKLVPVRLLLLGALSLCVTLEGCVNVPTEVPAPAPSVPAPPPAPPAPEPELPPPRPAVPKPAPLAPQDIQRTLLDALAMLETGQEEQALSEIRRVLQTDPANRLALHLQAQITDDPVALFGRESFPYRVQAGETLSRIAQRLMNDVHAFYGLARYNNIRVPRSLVEGQVLRIPGKAPPAASLVPAPTPAAGAPVAPPGPELNAGDVARRAEQRFSQKRAEDLAAHTRAARAAFVKQDLDGALKSWNAVLEIEPNNKTALLEKQRVLGLKERLQKVK